MSKTIESEKVLERTLVSIIEDVYHGMCLKLLTGEVIGLPDRICLLPGERVFFVELKTTGKKPRKIQVFIHNKLRALGFSVYVVDSTESLEEMLSHYERKRPTPVSDSSC